MWVGCDAIWFGSVRSALRLAAVLCFVDRCFGSWVLLGLLCLLRVTPLSSDLDLIDVSPLHGVWRLPHTLCLPSFPVPALLLRSALMRQRWKFHMRRSSSSYSL